jgi:mxaL protein
VNTEPHSVQRPALRDPRFWLMAAALVACLIALFQPAVTRELPRADALIVIDITTSMMVRDMVNAQGAPQSRLDAVKTRLSRALANMACGSRVGLAVFSERRSFLLLSPVEICANFAPVTGTLAALDWRMAWEGDSRLASGVDDALELATSVGSAVVFVTDGHEAPPRPPGQPSESGAVAKPRLGLLVGAGGDALSPIPKFDADGREVGFLSESDVVQENRSGLPPPGMEARPGWNARNAPFGGEAATGEEHLSNLHEAYLRELAAQRGLRYARLQGSDALLADIEATTAVHRVPARIVLAPALAALALALLILSSVWRPFRLRFATRIAGAVRLLPGRSTVPRKRDA